MAVLFKQKLVHLMQDISEQQQAQPAQSAHNSSPAKGSGGEGSMQNEVESESEDIEEEGDGADEVLGGGEMGSDGLDEVEDESDSDEEAGTDFASRFAANKGEWSSRDVHLLKKKAQAAYYRKKKQHKKGPPKAGQALQFSLPNQRRLLLDVPFWLH